jgi:alkanesulfonate monooxygenase SsuD/methylene tetrahydromethanopterin reductase-like flavin-dependent oxidoreductase (luciferase family)
LMRCFAGGTLDFAGKHYTYDNVPIVLEALQKPHPPLWYGIGSPETTVWAAKHNVNLLTNRFASDARVLHDRFVAEWALAKKDPANFPFFGTSKHIVVADTDEEAVAICRAGHARWIYHNTLLFRQRNVKRHSATVEDFDEALARGIVFAGSPATVRDALVRFIEESGINYLACRLAFGDLTFEQSKRSLDLLASKVFPDLAELKAVAV